MNDADKHCFVTALQQQFTQIFCLSKAGKDNSAERLRAQGFIHAGELLQLCHRQDVQQLMEAVHFQVFGCSIAERQPKESTRRQQALQQGDYSYFDEPAFERMR